MDYPCEVVSGDRRINATLLIPSVRNLLVEASQQMVNGSGGSYDDWGDTLLFDSNIGIIRIVRKENRANGETFLVFQVYPPFRGDLKVALQGLN